MMFIILTPENQSTLLSFSLFLSFVKNGSVAEKVLSGSTDVGLIVIKAWNSFSNLVDLFFVDSKRLIFCFTILWSDLFLCRNSLVVFTLMDMDSVLRFQMVD